VPYKKSLSHFAWITTPRALRQKIAATPLAVK